MCSALLRATRWGAAIVNNRRIDPGPCIPGKRTDLLPQVDDLRARQIRSRARRNSWGTNAT
jgi:hypothetical protein